MTQAQIPRIPAITPVGETSGETSPYARGPVFDQTTLPAAARRGHATKAGVWAVIRVLEGMVRYRIEAQDHDVILSPNTPGLVRPQEPNISRPWARSRCRSSSTITFPSCDRQRSAWALSADRPAMPRSGKTRMLRRAMFGLGRASSSPSRRDSEAALSRGMTGRPHPAGAANRPPATPLRSGQVSCRRKASIKKVAAGPSGVSRR